MTRPMQTKAYRPEPVQAPVHFFGLRLGGTLARFVPMFSDQAFTALVQWRELPEGWVAWHIEVAELDPPYSARVLDLRAMPYLAGHPDAPSLLYANERGARGQLPVIDPAPLLRAYYARLGAL